MPANNFFKGVISIHSGEDCINIAMTDPLVKIINLDEDGWDVMLSEENPQVIMGTILLPPVEAMWALVDGDKEQFNQIYSMHLIEPVCIDFLSALLAFIYRGGKLIVYHPDLNNECIKFLYNYFQQMMGIHISTSNVDPFAWNPAFIPYYCNSIYSIGAMTPYQYLYEYPEDALIPDNLYFKIINETFTPGDSLLDKKNNIDRLKTIIKSNMAAQFPIIQNK